jgi:hypothetical protein
MTDYKQLCADLVAAWDDLPWHYDWKGNLIGLADGCQLDDSAVERARTALAEPEPSTDRPDRLRVGDVWEFWTEVNIKGKTKPVDILLQWEVVGWHNGEYAWKLQSLDGEHKTYLMEFAPSYEEMRFIRSNETKAQ